MDVDCGALGVKELERIPFASERERQDENS